MTTTYNLFGIGQQSKSSNLTAQHRLNMYFDIQTYADKSQVAAIGTPGLVRYCYNGNEVSRGIHFMESINRTFSLHGEKLYKISPGGAAILAATLTAGDNNGYVTFANNGVELCIFTGIRAYIMNTTTNVFADITASLPYVTTPLVDLAGNSVTFLDGRFIAARPSTGQFYYSGLYDGLTWGALDFATAESNPDNLQAVIADKGNLCLLGTSTIELWTNSGDQAFSFTRINAAPSEGGLAARWSLSKIKGNVVGLFRDRSGGLSVCVLDGYTLSPVSNYDTEYLFNNYTSPSDAVGFAYTLNGLSFYQITFVTEGITWLYNFESQGWSQLKSTGYDRHLGNLCAAFNNDLLITSAIDGAIYRLDADIYTDDGATIAREITGAHVFEKTMNKMTIRRLRVDLEGGVGGNSDPVVMLQISRDKGHTWGNELWTTFGKVGEYAKYAEWRRLGLARDWVFKLRITDPVKCVIIAAVIEGEMLNK